MRLARTIMLPDLLPGRQRKGYRRSERRVRLRLSRMLSASRPRLLERVRLVLRQYHYSPHVVSSMHERKRMVAERADAFVAMPGGLGTLEECFEMWTWGRLGLHQKPLGILDAQDFFAPLLQFFLDLLVSQEFLRHEHRLQLTIGSLAPLGRPLAAEGQAVGRTHGSRASEYMARSISVVGLATVVAACASAPMRSGPLIDHFPRAACVPAGRVENVYPPGWLAWDYIVQTHCHARIVGAQASTGSIAVEYPPDPARRVVADFGEKSNPGAGRLQVLRKRSGGGDDLRRGGFSPPVLSRLP
jgi:hypothetical protein